MSLQQPTRNGEVIRYLAGPNRGDSPRIYYVNGVRVMPEDHAKEATMLSFHAERAVFGVYNLTGKEIVRRLGATGRLEALQEIGSVADFLECGRDWVTAVASQLGETGTGLVNRGLTATRNALGGAMQFVNQHTGWNLPSPRQERPIDVAQGLRNRLTPEQRRRLATFLVARINPTAASLFNQLYQHHTQPQWIVAHSQGNLVTADALWALAIGYGDEILSHVRVFSLASPTPAWPAGIDHRRKVYGHINDVITLADPHNWGWLTNNILNGRFGRVAGHWQQHGQNPRPGLGGHDMTLNVFQLNFINRFRRDLGLPEYPQYTSPPR